MDDIRNVGVWEDTNNLDENNGVGVAEDTDKVGDGEVQTQP